MKQITQELVKELFNYDSNTGKLYWKVNRKGHNIIGKEVGYVGSNGYLKTTVCCKHILNHQIIYLFHHGYLPENFIDHIDQNPLNNKIENLREVTHQCNLRNSKLNKKNKSGVKGVFLFKNLWHSVVQINKKTKLLYKGEDFVEAVASRLAAEQCTNWNTCESNSTSCKYIINYVKQRTLGG